MTDESEVASLLAFLRRHFPADIEGMTDPEEIGRRLVSVATSGPRNLLRALGRLHDDYHRLQ